MPTTTPAALTITDVESTERFTGTSDDPRQVLHVTVERGPGTAPIPLTVAVRGAGVNGQASYPPGSGVVRAEVPLSFAGLFEVGDRLPVEVTATIGHSSVTAGGEVQVAETGWTMVMVSHFHYDPVWWSTQAYYTAQWDLVGPDWSTRPAFLHNGFALVEAHLRLAVRDPDYCFVLAELDYLKPYFDTHPEQRTVLCRLLAEGRVELVGGTYNEPNTNLTGSETTIRNLVYGIGYQRDILGGDPQSAWQLDVFGHDPQFPGLVAKAGMTGSAWARGPHHQWGPMRQHWDQDRTGDVRVMQFSSEFEWISPSGDGVLTHYMPDHYGPGWEMQSAPTVEAAADIAYHLFQVVKPVASTRNTLLPVGGDYCPPNTWVTEVHRWWNARYVWPRFVCGTTRTFMDRVRTELAESGRKPSPQSRDMNPVYTGKDVSYIDTKQGQRAAETAALDAERLATMAGLLGAGSFPDAAMDKVWRHLAFGAHHDAITGSESDQVYVDLLTSWREAYDLAVATRDAAADALVARVDTRGDGLALVVLNTLSFARTDVVRAEVDTSRGLGLVGPDGTDVPFVVEAPGVISFVANDIPSLGWQTYRLVPGGEAPAWTDVEMDDPGITVLECLAYTVSLDSAGGGAMTSVVDRRTGRELLVEGGLGNELRVYEEYPAHPRFSEGPWHLLPNGRRIVSGDRPASRVRLEHSPIGQRAWVEGSVDGIDYEQVVTVLDGIDRVDLTTRILDHQQSDRLVRLRFPVDLPGGLPVSEVASAVVGRGFALIDADTAEAPWTLDNPANTWFGVGTTARVQIVDADGRAVGSRAMAVVEIVAADDAAAADARDLVVALARVGVTATVSTAGGSRYGDLRTDSNLPDLRIVLADRPNDLVAEIERSVGELPSAPAVFVPASRPLAEVWVPNADLRPLDTLPVLLLRDVEAAVAALATARVTATLHAPDAWLATPEPHVDGTVALLTYGLPGFAVEPNGALNLSLMRSCTGWPSGVWIDPPRRTAPDGSAFQLQHWTHEFHYALVSDSGDWRDAALPSRGQEFSTPLLALTADGTAGDLPPAHSLLHVSPERQVLVQTIKPTGNPVPQGRAERGSTPGPTTLRLVEATGLGSTARLAMPSTPVVSAARADLLEVECDALPVSDGSVEIALAGSTIETVVIATDPARDTVERILGPQSESAQPVFSRYWLHNRGPAPMGFLPVTISVEPTVARCSADRQVEVSWLVANQYDQAVSAQTWLDLPEGWRASTQLCDGRIEAHGFARYQSVVTVPGDTPPGQYAVAAQVRPETADLPGGTGAPIVEDVVTVFVGDSSAAEEVLGFAVPTTADVERDHQAGATDADQARASGLEVRVSHDGLSIRCGGSATLMVELRNTTRSRISGELQVASPWGTWDWVRVATRGFQVAPGEVAALEIEVAPPADTSPGHSWLLPKVMWFGRVQYGAAVRVEVVR